MKNLQIIFEIIKKNCDANGASNEQCFLTLGKLDVNNSMFFPALFYLRLLQSLGLIKLSRVRKEIILTDKGSSTTEIKYGIAGLALIFLHTLRRALKVAVMYILFWPLFLTGLDPSAEAANEDAAVAG